MNLKILIIHKTHSKTQPHKKNHGRETARISQHSVRLVYAIRGSQNRFQSQSRFSKPLPIPTLGIRDNMRMLTCAALRDHSCNLGRNITLA